VITDWLGLVTSQHKGKPLFTAWLTALLAPLEDSQNFAQAVRDAFDIDTAVGVQLDIIGQLVGRTRAVPYPLTGVYFAYDTGPGYSHGAYRGRFDPLTGLELLHDEKYRAVLKAKVLYNQWDGSIPGAVDGMAAAFPDTQLIVQTTHDTSMIYGLYGPLTPLDKAIFDAGLFDFKPAGVGFSHHFATTNRIFAYNTSGGAVAGYNSGAYLP